MTNGKQSNLRTGLQWLFGERFAGICLVLAILMLPGCGAREASISVEYGKVNGYSFGKSVNGVGVFADMIRQNARRVDRYRKISPRLNDYDVVIWFPEKKGVPSPEAIAAIELWLRNGYQRTFVYVGRGYDAEAQYWEDVLSRVDGEQHELVRRKRARAAAAEDTTRQNFFMISNEGNTCDWFSKVRSPDRKAKRLGGAWADDVVDQEASVRTGGLLKPEFSAELYDQPSAETLLIADGLTHAYRKDFFEGDGELIVVSNGSFLLNYGLVNQENRKIAQNLVELCEYRDVLFLESGPNGITVSETDAPASHNMWAWMNSPPLKYIAPQFLFWGVIFCFVYFPIFGRPRRTPKRVSSFRGHVDAFGRLLTRSKKPNAAKATINEYQTMVGDSSRKLE